MCSVYVEAPYAATDEHGLGIDTLREEVVAALGTPLYTVNGNVGNQYQLTDGTSLWYSYDYTDPALPVRRIFINYAPQCITR